MAEYGRVDVASIEKMNPGAAEVIAHLCEGDCLTFGTVVSWCESRNDCVHEVTCPSCGTTFHLDDEDIIAIERWTEANGDALVCGVRNVA